VRHKLERVREKRYNRLKIGKNLTVVYAIGNGHFEDSRRDSGNFYVLCFKMGAEGGTKKVSSGECENTASE